MREARIPEATQVSGVINKPSVVFLERGILFSHKKERSVEDVILSGARRKRPPMTKELTGCFRSTRIPEKADVWVPARGWRKGCWEQVTDGLLGTGFPSEVIKKGSETRQREQMYDTVSVLNATWGNFTSIF